MADPAYIVDGVLTDGEAWVGIATTTLSVDAGLVAFTSTDDGQVGDWSQYMDLVVIAYVRSSRVATDDTLYYRLNSDTGSNYAYQQLSGNGSAVTASSSASTTYIRQGAVTGNTAGANMFGAVVSTLFDINSGKYKSTFGQGAGDRDGGGVVDMWASTWKSQAPLTTIWVGCEAGNLMAGSKVSLFGVLPRMVA